VAEKGRKTVSACEDYPKRKGREESVIIIKTPVGER